MEKDRKTKVLIIEDQDEYRGVLRQLLENEGFEVSEAAEGRLAIEQAAAVQPKLIISDIVLPDMHGSEAVREIVKSNGFRDTFIIFLSSLIGNGNADAGEMKIDVDGKKYVGMAKSTSRQTILTTIDRVLAN